MSCIGSISIVVDILIGRSGSWGRRKLPLQGLASLEQLEDGYSLIAVRCIFHPAEIPWIAIIA